jgi:hypothetical protein
MELIEQPIWSEKMDQIVPALLEAKKDMGGAELDSANDFFSNAYASLGSVIKAVTDGLHANGLFLNHSTIIHESKVFLITEIVHISGQWKRCYLPIINKKGDDQGQGSSLTYSRRQAILAILAIPTVDDDGEKSADPNDPHRKRQENLNKQKPLDDIPYPEDDPEPISKNERDKLIGLILDEKLARDQGMEILAKHGIKNINDQIPRAKLAVIRKEIKERGKELRGEK